MKTPYWCRYANDWIAIRSTWALAVTQAEHDALARELRNSTTGTINLSLTDDTGRHRPTGRSTFCREPIRAPPPSPGQRAETRG